MGRRAPTGYEGFLPQDLPDGVIALILKTLMAIDPKTLVVSGPNLYRSWRAVCRDQIPLELHKGWDEAPRGDLQLGWDDTCTGCGLQRVCTCVDRCGLQREWGDDWRYVGKSCTTSNPRFPLSFQAYIPTISKRFRWVKSIAVCQLRQQFDMFANMHYLQHIDLTKCFNILDDEFEALVVRCTGLRRVILRHCNMLTDSAIVTLDRVCAGLEVLDLSDGPAITDVSIAALTAGCGRLKRRNLDYGYDFTAIDALTSGLTRLSHLSIEGCCDLVGPLIFRTNILTHLNLAACEGVTDDVIVSLAAECGGLICLNLCMCSEVTDVAVCALAAGCKAEELNLACCGEITDAAVGALAASTNLEYLNLARCRKITDASAEALAASCVNLKRLNLAECDNVSAVAINMLAAKGIVPGATNLRGRNAKFSYAQRSPPCEGVVEI